MRLKKRDIQLKKRPTLKINFPLDFTLFNLLFVEKLNEKTQILLGMEDFKGSVR